MKKMLRFLLCLTLVAIYALAIFCISARPVIKSSDYPMAAEPTPLSTPGSAIIFTPSPTPDSTPAPTPQPTPEPTPVPVIERLPGVYRLEFSDAATKEWLNYVLVIPENVTADMPLLVFLHGDGYIDSPDALLNSPVIGQAKAAYGDNLPFIMLLPNTRCASWETYKIPQTVLDLINDVAVTYYCRSDKIMLTGHSRGAIGTWNYISNHPELFSCAVPVSCCNDLPFDAKNASSVPVRAFISSSGDDFPKYGRYMEELVEMLQQEGGDAELTVLDAPSHGETEIYAYTRDLFDWMLEQ